MKGMKRKISRNFSYSVFYEHAAEGGYVAFVPALPGCHTQVETLEQTERNVKAQRQTSDCVVPGESAGPRGSHSRGIFSLTRAKVRRGLLRPASPALSARHDPSPSCFVPPSSDRTQLAGASRIPACCQRGAQPSGT